MNDAKHIPVKLFISIVVPLVIVTFGGFITYGSAGAFFFPATNQVSNEANGPAAIYYGLTLVVALMFFLMRQGYKGYEMIATGIISLLYSLALQRMTPTVFRPIYLYIVPLLLFFFAMWLILKYIFLNKPMRQFRLLIFSILGAAGFTLAFKIQFLLLKQQTDSAFLQARFLSGLMLLIFMGFGLSLAEIIIIKLEESGREITPIRYVPKDDSNMDDDDEAI
jgi:hypothetical protein